MLGREKAEGMEIDSIGYNTAGWVGFKLKVNGSYLIRVVDKSHNMEWTKQFISNRAHSRCLYQPNIRSRLVLKKITN